MRTGKFIFILGIIFLAAFLWAGGAGVGRNLISTAPEAQEKVSIIASSWGRIHRVLFIREALSSRLDRKNYVPLGSIPLALQQAVIAVEDNRFYRHAGFDIEGIIRATLVNVQTGSFSEGGSTITQQLVKNLLLTQEKTFARKLEEILLAVSVEIRYSKEEILEMYLNSIYFGSGAYGIGEASRIYFAKLPNNLTLAESAMLAGLPQAPSLYSPYVDLKAAKERQAIVLALMVRNGYIGPNAAEEAKKAPLLFAR